METHMDCEKQTLLEEIGIEELPAQLKQQVQDWLQWDKNPETWSQVFQLVQQKNIDRLSEMFLQRQCFGTAGIRGLMQPGFNGINDLVIIQTSQGLAKYLCRQNSDADAQTIVIGYDGRYNSLKFAKYTAKVFLESGFRVALFSNIVPTPFVSFATRLLSASAGVMITASHNPKQYNGYKVFASNGAQILSPHDQNIQNCILENLEPWTEDLWDVRSMSYDSKLFDPLPTVMEQYYRAVRDTATQSDLVAKSDLKVTYTALHGVGHEYLTKVFQMFQLKNYFPVLSQKDPDPEFPTVEFPNPEEGKGVFDESIKTASQHHDCSLIFANDPDSDRFCMAELQPSSNTWRVFNGNEIGAFLGWWLWKQFNEFRNNNNNKDGKIAISADDCYMISSAVSSKILQTMAKKEGFRFVETLTGFKWMANVAHDLVEKQGKQVLFCFEEAIGFMVGTIVYDKDGISTTATILQLAAYLQSQRRTFAKLLDQIYRTYGFHFSLNSYYLCYDPDKIQRIFNRIPDIDGANQYIKSIDGIKVCRVRDLSRGYDSSMADQKATLPKTCMVTFYFENGSVITFRTSGTEPKIKYYSEIVAQPDETSSDCVYIHRDQIRKSHRKLIESVVERILQPEQNGLIAKKN